MKLKTDASSILFILMLVMTASVYSFLPEDIPVKWDFYGNVIKTGSRTFIFLFPLLTGTGILMKKLFPKIDPKQDNYKSFEKTLSFIAFLIALFFLILEMIVIHSSFIPGSIDISTVRPFIIGVVITCIGNIMPQIRHNYFFGICTPWTLESEDVWFKTHRLGGAVWFVCGILMLLSVFMPVYIRYIFFGLYAITAVTIPTVYSYFEYRRQGKQI